MQNLLTFWSLPIYVATLIVVSFDDVVVMLRVVCTAAELSWLYSVTRTRV